MQPVAGFVLLFLDHVQAVGVALVRPVVELFLPGCLFIGNRRGTRSPVVVGQQGAAIEPLQQGGGRGFGITMDADSNFLDQPKIGVVGFNLDHLGVLGPVVQTVLRQGAEGTHARTQCQHHIGLRDQFHGRFGALVAQRSGP